MSPKQKAVKRDLLKNPDEVGVLVTRVVNTTETYLSRFPLITSLGESLGLRPIWIVAGFSIIGLSILTNVIKFITTAIGFFYPAWKSFKAIETNNHEDDKQWLTYWVVYAFLSFFEMFADFALTWIGGYHLIKLVVLLWMFLPQYKGATTIYTLVVRPILMRYEDHVDRALDSVAVGGKQLLADIVVTDTPRKKD